MMGRQLYSDTLGFHYSVAGGKAVKQVEPTTETRFKYTFENFFHPFVGELIAKLNRDSLPGMLNAKWQNELRKEFFEATYHPTNDDLVGVEHFPKEIDVSEHGPYANYNWELFFHLPMTVAVH